MSEIGAAFNINITTPGISQVDMQNAWQTSCITNTTFLDAFPLIKGVSAISFLNPLLLPNFNPFAQIMLFEYEKVEHDSGPYILRDYRLTNNTDILNGFKTSLTAIQDRFVWATVGGLGSGPVNVTSSSGNSQKSKSGGGAVLSFAPLLVALVLVTVSTMLVSPP
jgi:hypothetical protein